MPLITYEKLRGGQVFDVDLKAPPIERWKPVGRELGDDLSRLLGDVVELCEEHFSEVPAVLRPLVRMAGHGASRMAGRIVGLVASWYGGGYVAEIKGLAAAAEVAFSRVLLSNLMYDITQASEKFGGASACSSYSFNLRGRPVLARNMDWCWPDTIGRHTMLVRYHSGPRSYLSVGVVGMVGVLSAMYKGNWAVTLNQAPASRLPTNYFQWPALQRLRVACDGFGSFQGLVRRISAYETMSPFFAHVVGTEPDEHVIVSGMGREFARRRIIGRTLIQTNHFVDKRHEHLNPPDKETDRDGTVWTYDTRPRYKSLERRLRRLPRSLSEAMGRLRRSPVTTEATQHSMVFSPAGGKYRLDAQVT